MRVVCSHRRPISWIAAFAILLASLAPAMGHALVSATGARWIEICTAQGSKWIKADDDVLDSSPASAHVRDHCLYCSLQAPTLGLPPTQHLVRLPPGLIHEVPPAFFGAPRTLQGWVSAQPRAPPLVS